MGETYSKPATMKRILDALTAAERGKQVKAMQGEQQIEQKQEEIQKLKQIKNQAYLDVVNEGTTSVHDLINLGIFNNAVSKIENVAGQHLDAFKIETKKVRQEALELGKKIQLTGGKLEQVTLEVERDNDKKSTENFQRRGMGLSFGDDYE